MESSDKATETISITSGASVNTVLNPHVGQLEQQLWCRLKQRFELLACSNLGRALCPLGSLSLFSWGTLLTLQRVTDFCLLWCSGVSHRWRSCGFHGSLCRLRLIRPAGFVKSGRLSLAREKVLNEERNVNKAEPLNAETVLATRTQADISPLAVTQMSLDTSRLPTKNATRKVSAQRTSPFPATSIMTHTSEPQSAV